MNNIYFTPGPSQLYHTVPFHLQKALNEQIPSLSHRSTDFKKIVQHTKEQLTEILALPADYTILFTGSANEVWERIIQNLIIKSSHHLVNGAFSSKFYKFTEQYQLESSVEKMEPGEEFTLDGIPAHSELISVTINETSIGYGFNIENLKKLRSKYPDKLISADLVSAVPAIPFDFSLVDTAYFSVQKCFGLPAGLGVWIINKKAIDAFNKKAELNLVTGSYHNLNEYLKQEETHQTPETPNMLGIYLLGKVAEDMLNRGRQHIYNETTYKSALLYQTIEELEWASSFIKKKENRSKTVIVGDIIENSDFLTYMKSKKIIIGSGYGDFKKSHIRIANFPAHSKEQIEMLCDLIKAYG